MFALKSRGEENYMKWYIYLLLMLFSMQCFGADNPKYFELDRLSKEKLLTFKTTPSLKKFEELKSMAEQMIALDDANPKGYLALVRTFHASAGTLLDKADAYKAAYDVLEKYQSRDVRSVDLSELQKLYREKMSSALRKAKIDRDTERMLENVSPPPYVNEVRAIMRQYNEKARAGVVDETLLDKALDILMKELLKDGVSGKVYLEMFRVYMDKSDYANAYVVWELAVHFCDADDPVLWDATKDLYQKAQNYEVNYGISEENVGPNPIVYFLWLNKGAIGDHLPPGYRLHLDGSMERTRKLKARLVEEQSGEGK